MSSPQTIIAMMWDFDQTLSPHYMQKCLFEEYGIDEKSFWAEKEEQITRAEHCGITYDENLSYLNLLLRYVHDGKIPDLSNQKLRQCGAKIKLFPGLPHFFPQLKETIEEDQKYRSYGITVEHYVISSGLKEMIVGSSIYPYLNGVFASEFVENKLGVIADIACSVGYSKKPEFIYTINKGANVNKEIDLNGKLPKEHRRVPFENMIYIADGPSDVPCFATLKRLGGKSFAVYNTDDTKSFEQAFMLQEQDRIFTLGPADYSPGSHTSRVLEYLTKKVAERIIADRMRINIGLPGPRH